jgi:predicted transcriptional regulator
MKAYNGICADIVRCEREQQAAIEAGKEAEATGAHAFATC